MAVVVRRGGGKKSTAPVQSVLPLTRSVPRDDPWAYSYLIHGQPKIGKTSLAIACGEELVLQFDAPQEAYAIRELVPENWLMFMAALKELEARAARDDFPYDRIVVDGVDRWYQHCYDHTCGLQGLKDPPENDFGRTWRQINRAFLDAISRLHKLRARVTCGLFFICHSHWRNGKDRKTKVEYTRLEPQMTGKCAETVEGIVDACFAYVFRDGERILVIDGDDEIDAGSRIDGRFRTPDSRRVVEIPMGKSATEAMENLLRAFRNEQEFATVKERDAQSKPRKAGARRKTS